MKRLFSIFICLLAVSLLLCGCAMRTVDELYCLPKRSQSDNDLQSVINHAMGGLEYCAPQSGDNRLVVQAADLDGDGVEEYLLFAKDSSEKPLKILIFCQLASGYVLMDTIEGYGFGFDFITYQQLDDKPGMEIVVGRLVSEEVVRSVSVYRFSSGFSRLMLSAAYSRMSVTDLNGDGVSELYLLNQNSTESGRGSLIVYNYFDEELQRLTELPVSSMSTGYKQIVASALTDGTKALFVTCEENDELVTDVFVTESGTYRTVASGLVSGALAHNLVYPKDMNGDGSLELAKLIPMQTAGEKPVQYLIQWYQLQHDGSPMVTMHTYHNFQDNWFVAIEEGLCDNLYVERTKDQCAFYANGSSEGKSEKLFVITALKDADREELSQIPGRIVLYSGDSVIYVADIMDDAQDYGITQAYLLSHFNSIRVDLNTQED